MENVERVDAVDVADVANQDDSSIATALDAGSAADAVGAEEQEQRRQADKVLKLCGRAYAGGEKAYRAGLLESGKLADDYVHRRLTLGDARGAAVDTVKLELQRYSSGKVDVNRLIGCFHAYRLLAVETGLTTKEKGKSCPVESIPYGHYKNAWALLVDRVNPGMESEYWALLNGMESDCLEAFRKALDANHSREACEETAKGLLRQHASMMAIQQRADADAARDAADFAKQEAEEARQALQKATVEATAAPDDTAAQQALATAKTEALQATATEAKASKDASKLERLAESAEEKQERAQEREERIVTRNAEKAPVTRLDNILKTGQAATAKDAAEICVGVISGNDEPDSVLEIVLKALAVNTNMSKPAQRACDAAILILTRAEKQVA